jgi:hypothetical protein
MRTFHHPEGCALIGQPAFEFVAVHEKNINNFVCCVEGKYKQFYLYIFKLNFLEWGYP